MKHLLKLLHLLAAIGFAGGLAVSLLLAGIADDSTATAYAAGRRLVSAVAEYVVLPSLVVLVTTGLLLMVKQPALIDARWVWLKALIGTMVGGIALLVVQPAVTRVGALARLALEGSPAFGALAMPLRAEMIGGAINLALSLAAIALAVWRPRLGRNSN